MLSKKTVLEIGREALEIHVPARADILSMTPPEPLADPRAAIEEALRHSLGSPGLEEIVRRRLADKPDAAAAVVISDNTRPVPYRGEQGILWPVVDKLLECGLPPERITVIVAAGTHRALGPEELEAMLDPRVLAAGIKIRNHDGRDASSLAYLGETSRGSVIYLNREYLAADLKILTGLVESHFMAGASGGRKSICPGLVGEQSTFVFHGAPMLASPLARDLVLEGNPCHEEALEVARMAGADYIVNVTLDHCFRLTGVFAGDLERAHAEAVARLREYAIIPIEKNYDLVIGHAGFVGVNHYQAAKAGVAAIPALKPGGRLIVVADNIDPDPVGSPMYRMVLHLLKLIGAERFIRLLHSPDWVFIPEQWQVQMWARLFAVIPMAHLIYYAPQLSARDYAILPGRDGNEFLPPMERYRGNMASAARVIEDAAQEIFRDQAGLGRELEVAVLADGPYGIPWKSTDEG
ncbi:MAG: lactate racemase domain-containing protein [Bacteroidota bacterium]